MKKINTDKLIELHKGECLCWGCIHFKPNTKDNCPISQELTEFNKKFNVSTPIWECETFESKK